MGIKFALNILYNLCIIICLITIWSGFKNGNWAFVAGAFFIGVLILIFKIRLIKDIKNLTKKP
jgi:Na+/melibiose symporter-like transporter